jgi:hypothetical protein
MDEDRIINKLIEIDERVARIEENMVKKDEFHAFKDQMSTTLDQQSVILKRLDEERHFTVEWVRRIEADVERIKTHLQIA